MMMWAIKRVYLLCFFGSRLQQFNFTKNFIVDSFDSCAVAAKIYSLRIHCCLKHYLEGPS